MSKRIISMTLALLMLLCTFSAITVNAENVKILNTLSIKVGETKPLNFTDPSGNKVDVIWESTDPDVATVDSYGNVTAKKVGTCIMSTWWNSKLYGVNIVVNAASSTSSTTNTQTAANTTVKKISISKTKLTLTVGKSSTIKLNNATASKIKWSTSNKSVATVSSGGVVKAEKAGKVTITAKYKGKSYKCAVTVKAKKIKLNKTSFSLTVGKSTTLKLSNATASKVKWSTSNKKIATVSSKGVVKGKKAGKVTITATYKNKKYKCTVTVKKSSMTQKQAFDKLKNYLIKKGEKKTGQYETQYYIMWTDGGIDYCVYYSNNNIYMQVYTYVNGYEDMAQFVRFNASGNAYAEYGKYNNGSNVFGASADFKKSSLKSSVNMKYKLIVGTPDNANDVQNQPNALLQWVLPGFNAKIKSKAGVTLKQLGFTNWDK